MNRDDLNHAIKEAERFLARAKDLAKAPLDEYGHFQPRKSAAVKRASMDLTHALPALRR